MVSELKEQAVKFETMRHIERVRNLLNGFVVELLKRGELHDQSKLEPPESPIFAEYTGKLAEMTYGSDEYKDSLEAMKPAIEHHQKNNRHHPEFHENGINDMNLIDVLEMFCDWKAASERHNDGDLRRSIEINKHRFKDVNLSQIFENTVDLIEAM